MKIMYKPHLVTPERKAELRSYGFKIIGVKIEPDSADVIDLREVE